MTNTATLALVPSPADYFAAGLGDTPPNPNLVHESEVRDPETDRSFLDVLAEIEEHYAEQAYEEMARRVYDAAYGPNPR